MGMQMIPPGAVVDELAARIASLTVENAGLTVGHQLVSKERDEAVAECTALRAQLALCLDLDDSEQGDGSESAADVGSGS